MPENGSVQDLNACCRCETNYGLKHSKLGLEQEQQGEQELGEGNSSGAVVWGGGVHLGHPLVLGDALQAQGTDGSGSRDISEINAGVM